MKAYLAARYSRRHELLGYRGQLAEIGIEVTSRWLNGTHQYGPDAERAQAELGTHDDLARRFATEDVEDLRAADVVVSFTETPRVPSTNRGGRHVELGLALGLGKLVMNVGPRENAFHYLAGVETFEAWPDALLRLGELAPRPSKGMPVVTVHLPLDAMECVELIGAVERLYPGATAGSSGSGLHIWKVES